MSANVDDLGGGTSILSSLCHQHEGSLFVDPASGDAIFQSYGGSSATSSVTMTSTSFWSCIASLAPTSTVASVPHRVVHITLLGTPC